MDAFELLKADHKKVAQLFDQLESARGSAKLNVFKQIKNELELHTHVEESIFYPALEKPEETHDLTLEAYEEHKVVKTLLSELGRARSANDEWQAKAKVLRESVEHHVDEEENELFDKADDVLSDEEIEALGVRMEAEKARKQGRPVPKRAVKQGAKPKPKGENRGVLSKLASLVGLGEKSERKSAPARKKAAASAEKGRKRVAAKTSSKSKTRKAAGASASKRSAAAHGAKRARTARPATKSRTKLRSR